jgi:hypothetical protein
MIVGSSLHNLGHVALHSGDLALAAAQFRRSLLIRWRLGPGTEVAAGLAGMASVAFREGQLIDGVRILGAADSMLESTGFMLSQADELVRGADSWTKAPSLRHSPKGMPRGSRISRR